MPSKLIASSFALIAFTAAIIAGMAAQNPATTTLWRALLAMGVCYFVGLGLAAAGRYVIREHVERYRQEHPIEPIATAPDDGIDYPTEELEARSDQIAQTDPAPAPYDEPGNEPGVEPGAEPASDQATTDETTERATGPTAGAAA